MRTLHRVHAEQGLSARELGRRIWRAAGFKNPNSAMQAILARWEALELPVHRPINQRRTEEGRAARRQHRRETGEVQAKRCRGYNNRGNPCSRWARPGEDYCSFHLKEVRT
jgi:hypothetical protein